MMGGQKSGICCIAEQMALRHDEQGQFLAHMPSRRLEDRIRELCAMLAQDPQDPLPLIRELREALREHARRLESFAKEKLVNRNPIADRRRRSSPPLSLG
jgi:hypothetical protein